MRKFELIEPKSLAEACAILANESDAKAIAGGTALLTIIKQGLLLPKLLVNLQKIGDAAAITFDPVEGLRIGALATINEIETSETVQRTIRLSPKPAMSWPTSASATWPPSAAISPTAIINPIRRPCWPLWMRASN